MLRFATGLRSGWSRPLPRSYSAAHIPKYRTDIDGLRAVAVIPVVLFHAYPGLVPGGFVGVDIFYVISGYLITGVLVGDLERGSFSILAFYERRIRRIFPALYFMLAVSAVLAVLLLPPLDLADFDRSLVAATLFSSNFLFWLKAGYFDGSAALTPLLHTWSLAIEEQFYIFFPPFLFLAWRIGRPRLLMWAVLMISLVLSIVVSPRRVDASFYLIPTRAWELMLGAVLVFGTIPGAQRRWVREAIAAAGLFLILASLFMVDDTMPFPGFMALLPCGGAALLIHAGSGDGETLTGRFLSQKPMVFVGLISYSLYLWHWPALVFARYVNLDPLSPLQASGVVLAAVVVSIFSWRFVERPFRRGRQAVPSPLLHRFVKSRGRVILSGLVVMAVFVFCGVGVMAVLRNNKLVSQFYGKDIAAVTAVAKPDYISSQCLGSVDRAMGSDCLLGDRSKPTTAAIWGDSIADALAPAFADIDSARSAYGFLFLSCPSILGTTRVDDRPAYRDFGKFCSRFNRRVFDVLKHLPAVKLVVLTSNYTGNFDAPGKSVYLVPEGYRGGDPAERDAMLVDRIVNTVEQMRSIGKKVVVLGAYYSAERLGAQRELRALMRDPDARQRLRVSVAIFDEHTRLLNDRLRQLNDPGVVFVDPRGVFCPNAAATGVCAYDQGLPLTIDGMHFTSWGAHLIARAILKALRNGDTSPSP